MELYPHQVKVSQQIQEKISTLSLAILQAPERSGKTLATINAIENIDEVKQVLWITKKAAIDGIKGDLQLYAAQKSYTVINYESIHKLEDDFDLIVLDEFHYAISSYPKTPAKAKIIRDKWLHVPKILISATPAPESGSQWFHPLWLCAAHPFSEEKSFYKWARKGYVQIKQRHIFGRVINDYSNARSQILNEVKEYLIQLDRSDLGFKYEPKIVPHYVPLSNHTQTHLRKFKAARVIDDYFADTPLKLINGLYQLECGAVKIGEEYRDMGNREYVNYIKQVWGDTKEIAIMTRWVGQRILFEQEFKNALILSSHSHAEGVELSHIEHLIIASMDYSTARFQQRNARQASAKRKTPINVNILMTKGWVSEAVFQAVSEKHQDFKARMFLGDVQ
jgi:hypothetical protein